MSLNILRKILICIVIIKRVKILFNLITLRSKKENKYTDTIKLRRINKRFYQKCKSPLNH